MHRKESVHGGIGMANYSVSTLYRKQNLHFQTSHKVFLMYLYKMCVKSGSNSVKHGNNYQKYLDFQTLWPTRASQSLKGGAYFTQTHD